MARKGSLRSALNDVGIKAHERYLAAKDQHEKSQNPDDPENNVPDIEVYWGELRGSIATLKAIARTLDLTIMTPSEMRRHAHRRLFHD